MKNIPLKIAYRLLNHGPVVMVSSLFNGKADVTPIAWNVPINDDPPVIALCIWPDQYIYKCIMKTRDFVLNIPDDSMVKTVVQCGTASGSAVDKFKEFNLKKQSSRRVRSPRLKGCMGYLECKLINDRALARKYHLVLGKVVWVEADSAMFKERWLFEKGMRKTIHHIGNKIFVVPDSRIVNSAHINI